MTDETVYRTMLFDFYGELLTDKQRDYFDLHYNEDYSLGEIAEMTGISRQGVWDIIKRAEDTLRKTEEKTGLVHRFRETQASLAEIEASLRQRVSMTQGEARVLAEQLTARVHELKEQ